MIATLDRAKIARLDREARSRQDRDARSRRDRATTIRLILFNGFRLTRIRLIFRLTGFRLTELSTRLTESNGFRRFRAVRGNPFDIGQSV